MIYFLTDICTILKPMIQESGVVEFEDFGDYFCRIEKKKVDALCILTGIKANGAEPGYRLITPQHTYIIVSVDNKNGILGLVVQK